MQVAGKGKGWGLQGSVVRGNDPGGVVGHLVGVERRDSLSSTQKVKPTGLGLQLDEGVSKNKAGVRADFQFLAWA